MRAIVSVIVPTRNRPGPLREALLSIAAQDLEGVQAVVVNDGGRDVTPVVRALGGALPVRLVTLVRNAGLATARNIGIEAAEGRFVAFLDDDDVDLPHHLRTAVDALHHTDADLVYTNCLVSDRRVDPRREGTVEAPSAFDFPFDRDALAVLNYIPVTGVVCRSLRRVHARFDPSLPVLEDLDLWLQLTRRETFRVVHVPEATVVYHRVPSETSMTTAAATEARQFRLFAQNQRRLYRRWPVPPGSCMDRYRRHVLWMHRFAEDRLNGGHALSHFYYERVLRLVLDGLAGRIDEHSVVARLPGAVSGEAA